MRMVRRPYRRDLQTSWGTYQVGKRIINVKFLAMPNLLADREIFPELIQDAATGPRIAEAVLDLWRDAERRKSIQLSTANRGRFARQWRRLGTGGKSDSWAISGLKENPVPHVSFT